MSPPVSWSFPPFRLDLATGSLWRDKQLVPLSPKPLAVLATLVAQAGQVVTKEALLEAAWPDAAVTEGVLKGCIRQIRRALGETAGTSQYIATVHRRGYRFLASVTSVPVKAQASKIPPAPLAHVPSTPALAVTPPSLMVARQAELAQLHQCWTRACQGERQVVCIAGEAGIGKTTLVDAFVAQVAPTAPVWIGRGQCIEQHGAGEPYLPLLEALGRLGRGADGAHLVALLHQYAPSWLVHLPALVVEADAMAVQRRAGEAPRERMLRELAEAVEAMTVVRPLILVLEDLHWSDVSTVEWLAYMARRRDRTGLLLLGTYRPGDAMLQEHPVHRVTQELFRQRHATALPLSYLPEAGVTAYLDQRFETAQFPEAFARTLYQHTQGHPFFLVAMVDSLLHQGILTQGDQGWNWHDDRAAGVAAMPESVRQLIVQQLDVLSPEEQELLEVASVAGVEFTTAAVAAGVDHTLETIEARYEALARREQFVQAHHVDTWPDGTITACYRFLHDLYKATAYDRVPASRRMRWHRQIGARLEAGYGSWAPEIAAELAEHFVRGQDIPRAVLYLERAGDNARQRSALHEAATHLQLGLDLLTTLPALPQRMERELTLLFTLGLTLSMMQGQAAPEVGHVYERARVLCQQLDDTPRLFHVLMGLRRFYSGRGALQTARVVAEQLDELAQRSRDPEHLMEAHFALGLVSFCLGDLALCRTHTGRGLSLEVSSQPNTPLAVVHGNRRASCLNYAALALWGLGYPDQALQQSQAAVVLSQQPPVPSNLAFTLHFAACLRQLRREAQEAERLAAATMALATDYELGHWLGQSTILYGWAIAAQGQREAGLEHLHQGLAAMDSTGSELLRPYYLALLAEVYGDLGQPTTGLAMLEDAWTLVDKNSERWYVAELYRLQGLLLLQQEAPDVYQAEQCFQHALRIAQRQQARALELRTASSLSQIWQQHGKRHAAHALLADVYNWFTEGFDTADLQEARQILAALQ
jgi:DNA-binding winged helix-turn-helix (wHTH) protein/predicted ATPase